MNDEELVRRIGELVEQEHEMERSHGGEPLSADDRERREAIEVALDQCWDLLRRRRARRKRGEDPDEASVRPAEVVEDYQQ